MSVCSMCSQPPPSEHNTYEASIVEQKNDGSNIIVKPPSRQQQPLLTRELVVQSVEDVNLLAKPKGQRLVIIAVASADATMTS